MGIDNGVRWRSIDAVVIGSSHLSSQSECQDAAATRIVGGVQADTLLIALSDGAGSAKFSARGSASICTTLLDVAQDALVLQAARDLTDDEVRGWLLLAREHLAGLAREVECDLREFASTALLIVVAEDHAICVQVGDGAIIVRESDDQPFEVAHWPASGEYANQTFFLTETGVAEGASVRRFGRLQDVLGFTDGLQLLGLSNATRSAYSPFCLPLIATLRSDPRADDDLREALRSYLASDVVRARSDDDLSLVLATRLSA